MTIVPIPSIRTLGCFCACLLLLVSLPATASAQSLESSTPGAIAAESSASTTPGGPAAQPATTDTRPGPPTEALGLAANPRAVTGGYYSGLLQRALGLSADSPVKFGGILDLGGNWLASGGLRPNSTSGDFVFGLNFDVDAEKLLRIPGGEFYASGGVYHGTDRDSNGQAGSVQVYDGLAPTTDFHRLELYELWWRQRLFEDRLILKIGKINASGEFGQVLNPVPIPEAHMRDWTISDLLYAPAGDMPTNFGKLPTYPDPAWGVTVSLPGTAPDRPA